MPQDEKQLNWQHMDESTKETLKKGRDWAQAKQDVGAWMGAQLKASNLPAETQKAYQEASDRVFERWSAQKMKRFMQGVNKGARFFKDNKTLNTAYANYFPDNKLSAEIRAGKKSIGGLYWHSKKRGEGKLFLDGDQRTGLLFGKQKTHEIYSHEFTHAWDGVNAEISNSPEWQSAWETDINGRGVSRYSWTDAAEGLAEFGRLIDSVDEKGAAKLWSKYPNAMQVGLDTGLHEYARPGI
jgi:hypothetical protein